MYQSLTATSLGFVGALVTTLGLSEFALMSCIGLVVFGGLVASEMRATRRDKARSGELQTVVASAVKATFVMALIIATLFLVIAA